MANEPHAAEKSVEKTAEVDARRQDDTVPFVHEAAAESTARDVPEKIGKYVVVGELDSGGQAVVYRAVHPTLQRELVIKLAKQPAAGGRFDPQRLVSEGKVLAELDHPHIARIFDLDFHEGRPYLVMQYIRGQNLMQYCGSKPLPQREAAGLVAKIAQGLAHAHAHGVLHRDLKPANILIDQQGEPKIIDFGLADLRHGWTDTTRDHPSSVSGTAQYMPPEQARGETDKVDQQSDVFALGAVLYFLLTGKAPFAGSDTMDALHRSAECQFDRDALFQQGIDRKLADACLTAMSADKRDRFAHAKELAAKLAPACGMSTKRKFQLATSVGPIGCGATITFLLLIGSVVLFTTQSLYQSAGRRIAQHSPPPVDGPSQTTVEEPSQPAKPRSMNSDPPLPAPVAPEDVTVGMQMAPAPNTYPLADDVTQQLQSTSSAFASAFVQSLNNVTSEMRPLYAVVLRELAKQYEREENFTWAVKLYAQALAMTDEQDPLRAAIVDDLIRVQERSGQLQETERVD